MPMVIIHDLRLEFEDLSAQIDYVVVTRKIVFFIECKNLFGNIDIDNQGNFVRRYTWNGRMVKEGIYSPITQNQRHLEVFRQIKRSNRKNPIMKYAFEKNFDNFYRSIVVLANPKTVLNAKYAKKEVKNKVIRADQLVAYIKNAEKQSKDLASSEKGMKEWAEGILALHKPNQTDYTQKYEERIVGPSETIVKAETTPPVVAENSPEFIPAAEPGPVSHPQNIDLVAKLKAFRLEKSREEDVKAYYVFTDKQMHDLIARMPKSPEELMEVSGFGPVKVEKYGRSILALLN
jgi:superfamily II DNA helicase RecQ